MQLRILAGNSCILTLSQASKNSKKLPQSNHRVEFYVNAFFPPSLYLLSYQTLAFM